jgi:hypothetical protein
MSEHDGMTIGEYYDLLHGADKPEVTYEMYDRPIMRNVLGKTISGLVLAATLGIFHNHSPSHEARSKAEASPVSIDEAQFVRESLNRVLSNGGRLVYVHGRFHIDETTCIDNPVIGPEQADSTQWAYIADKAEGQIPRAVIVEDQPLPTDVRGQLKQSIFSQEITPQNRSQHIRELGVLHAGDCA